MVPDVDAEQRLCDDAKRQLHHVVVNQSRLAVGPFPAHLLRTIGHHLGVHFDTVGVERRLDEATVAPPLRALAVEDAVSGEGAENLLEALALHVVLVVLDENVFDVVRVVELVDVAPNAGPVNDVAVLAGHS